MADPAGIEGRCNTATIDDPRPCLPGSVISLRGVTPQALMWMDEHLPDDFNGVIEARFFPDIRNGIENEGMTLV